MQFGLVHFYRLYEDKLICKYSRPEAARINVFYRTVCWTVWWVCHYIDLFMALCEMSNTIDNVCLLLIELQNWDSGYIPRVIISYYIVVVSRCPSMKGLQRMVDICAEFGLEFSVTNNVMKTKCMKFERKPVMPKAYPIRNDLSESDEIMHKQCDFIGRSNGLLAR